jgi:hypothetical protein
MNPSMPSSSITKFYSDIGVIKNIIEGTRSDSVYFNSGVLYSAGVHTTVKSFGILNSQLASTQTDNFLAANLAVPNNYVGITCLSGFVVPTQASTGVGASIPTSVATILNNFLAGR